MTPTEEFVNVAKPSSVVLNKLPTPTFIIKDSFSLYTLLAVGAIVQVAMFAILPPEMAVLPCMSLVLHALARTVIGAAYPQSNRLLVDVVPGRTSAQLADAATGRFGNAPASRPLVVFHFGVRFNHPLGVLSPGAREVSEHFARCYKSISEDEAHGMLGVSSWRAAERGSHNTQMLVFYFRDLEAVHRFAQSPVHQEAWAWVTRSGWKHIGVFHEAFCVEPGAYETIYVNMPPLLMGATACKVPGGWNQRGGGGGSEASEEREEVSVMNLVSANHQALRTQLGRMRR
ncbi:hypothetical protein MPH_13308 [Macrophomina phaseolina MS6]|uniref:Dimeric alpha-beta barrel n=1 Tax=Macrophomina phaseolina (strain MS6) TaxID=1126212 RepID=K2R645_MACPH|nr:hypothetical protein MPH_13308 [Macrophomina phaseolina MS6]